MPAGAGAHDQRDLRDHAGGVHVAAEDLAVQAERDHALLDARAGALVDADDRAAGLHGEVHHLDDLLAVDLAERAAEDGEVLGEHAHLAAVDGAVAGDHAVAVGPVLLQAERRRAVPGELVELDERALVEEQLDPLAGGLACPWRAASRPPSPSRRAPPRRGAGRGRRACRPWCGCRCPSGTSVPSPGCALALTGGLARLSVVGQSSACDDPDAQRAHPSTPTASAAARLARRGASRRPPSTNAVVAERARAGEPRGPGAWSPSTRPPAGAGSTATGRRRRGRALTFSVLLRPDACPAARWPWLPLLTGLAVADAVRAADRRRRRR